MFVFFLTWLQIILLKTPSNKLLSQNLILQILDLIFSKLQYVNPDWIQAIENSCLAIGEEILGAGDSKCIVENQ